MGLAAAAACCMVGGAGGGLPLEAGHENTALLDALNSALAEPFALAWSQDSPRLFTCVHGGLCGSGYRGRDGSEEHPPRRRAWLGGLGRCVSAE